MPKKRPVIRLVLEATLDHDFDRYSDGNLRMLMGACDISRSGKKLGYVAAALPAGIVINTETRSWYVSPEALWNAVEEAERGGYPATTTNR